MKKLLLKMFLPSEKEIVDSAEIREKWLEDKLKELNGNIIDCGAGIQRYRKLCAHLEYTSQDFCGFDGKAVAGLDRDGEWDTHEIDIVSDIVDIPVQNESFDNILCTEVFEHIAHPEKAIREFSRILKSGGTLVLTAPFSSWTHMAPFHFCTGFNRYWYEKILDENGFEVISITASGNYFNCVAEDVMRLPIVSEKYSKKMGIIYKLLTFACVKMLYKLSLLDRGSSEFGCFEYLVLAKKR